MPREFEVRGEVYMPKPSFAALNQQLEEDGKQTYANPRNAAAGAVRQLNPTITASRGLQTYMYQLDPPGPARSQSEVLTLLGEMGFRVNPNRREVGGDEIAAYLDHWRDARHDLDYQTDGVVIKVDFAGDPGRAGGGVAVAALGDRLQVPARGAADPGA